MSLNEYRRKRVFGQTPEPEPKVEQPGGSRFFIQRHSARRLHYDLRLEMEGVLRSWALPHGPTLDPAIKRLAVLVEDHPLEYGSFEGTIPSGNYGAGKVTLWDRGTYELLGPKSLSQQWEAGDLKIRMHGQRLMGEFALVRTKRGNGKDWLLIKKNDFAVQPGWDPESDVRSILPGKPNLSTVEGAIEAPMPSAILPMMAIASTSLPLGTDWLYEVKWDGVRALCSIEKQEDNARVRVTSRKGASIDQQYPEMQEIAQAVDAQSAIFDGEIVVFGENGVPSFQLLQNRIGASARSASKLAQSYPVNYFAFDLLYLDGYDLRATPLADRKQLLASVLQSNATFRNSEHFVGKGAELLQAVREKGLEGVVAKQAFSKYESKRSRDWVKVKVVSQQDFVICGWLEGERDYFGALALAYYEDGRLVYAGNAGSGFTQESLKAVHEKLEPLKIAKSPLVPVPKDMGVSIDKVTWVKPELVCTVRFTSWTDDIRLRAPVFQGLRTDIMPEECVREIVAPSSESESGEAAPRKIALLHEDQNEVVLTIEDRRLKFTNLKKVFYPQEGYTKGDVINFYAAISDLILPHLKGRPLSLRRYPNGIESSHFFQKDAPPSFPEWLRIEQIVTDDDGSSTRFVVADDRSSLLYLANLGCIDQNPWMSRIGTLDHPDFILLDLDPYHCGYDRIVEAAQLVRHTLDQIGLHGYPKTTGGDGMHIYVPVEPIYTYQQVRSFAEILARLLAVERPDLFTTPRAVASREKGKVYFDYLQISHGKTISAPYVLRAHPGAPVATPLAWHEVRQGLTPTQFHIGNAVRRFERVGDLFEGVLKKPQKLDVALEGISKIMQR
ncbi:MAG TPA: DNA ligase D [Candidatus Angelobacter sp.]|jgi:bifunctional non-homologous end joining protein LigD|nr:DNA ligase D [Candidatus Angelobacter sp.]